MRASSRRVIAGVGALSRVWTRIQSPDISSNVAGSDPVSAGSSPVHASPGRRARRVGERRRRDPGGDRRPVPGRRLERSRRPHPEWDRPQRHPHELRGHDRNRRRRSLDDLAGGRRGVVGRSRREGRRVRVALRPGRGLLAVHDHGSELPPRGPGGERRRDRHLVQHLAGVLRRALGPHRLRGVSGSRRRNERQRAAGDLADPRCPGAPATRCTRPTTTPRALRTCSR